MARPRNQTEARDCVLQTLVTRTELKDVLANVPVNETVSNYLRRIILSQTKGTGQPAFKPEDLPE